MKTTLKWISFFSLGLVSNISIGQTKINENNESNNYVRCYSVENEADLLAKHPNRLNAEQFEAWLSPHIEKIKADKKAGKNIQAVYNIPVVIHIVHDGDDVGYGENITDAQAISQITVMNQDYRRIASTPGGVNSTGLAVDTEINFVLAQKDPSGNPSTGVVRHTIIPYSNNVADGAGGRDWETKADVETLKTNTQWDPTKYLNMWTVRVGGNTIANGGISDLLGYAQFPSNSGLGGLNASGGASNTDGVVSAFDAMGTNALNDGSFVLNPTYNLGRTMTHEVGHWLGLRHIWGDNATCPTTNTNTDKDYCADTPAANTANYTCNLTADTCPTTPGNDMVQNYMDYTNDSCMDTFTNDQKTRMQAVMTASPNRNSLNTSTAGVAPSAGIYFKKIKNTYSPTEGTNCNYTDINYPVSIIKAPTANAVVTFNINAATTATLGKDFDIVTPTVTLNSGTTSSQDLIIRYYNDGTNETSKKVVIGMTVNANGGDAVIISGYGNEDNPSLLTCTIIDNDIAPSTTTTSTLLSLDFQTTTGWTTLDGDGDSRNWGVLNSALNGYGTAPNTISGQCGYSEKNLTYLGGTGSANPNNFIISPQITIPNGIVSGTLSYIAGCYHNGGANVTGGNLTVYFTTDKSSAAAIIAGTTLEPSFTVTKATTVLKSNNITSLAGQTGYFVFRHSNNTAATGLLLLDSVTVNITSNTQVQTVVDTATQYQATINTTGTAYAKDSASGLIIADHMSTTNFDYGCTTVAVTRDQNTAGAVAVNYGSDTANNLKVLAKSVTINSTNLNTAATGSLKFYFSESEIASWETATGNSRNNLRIIKQGNTSTTPATLGSFGVNTTLTGNFSNGLNGVYYFGIDRALAANDFEFESFNLFPNPNNGSFTIKLASDANDVKIVVNDIRGRQIFEKSYTNDGIFDQTINLNNVQAGVYLVTATDGIKKTVRRIIIE